MLAVDEHAYFTYIVASRSRTLYIGVTGNLRRRVFEHKWREHEGFTERYNCDRLVWFERYQDIVKAINREKQLKRWRREKKIALIEIKNPAWVDLSKDWYDIEPADLQRSTSSTKPVCRFGSGPDVPSRPPQPGHFPLPSAKIRPFHRPNRKFIQKPSNTPSFRAESV